MKHALKILWSSFQLAAIFFVVLAPFAPLQRAAAETYSKPVLCDDNNPLCPDTFRRTNYEGNYIGHDEPSVLFYDDRPGAGNSSIYRMTLPKDPAFQPKQDGTGGTYNFQLHPAFWLGMAMCDPESSPNYTKNCTPDSDTNIFDSPNPNAPDYIGHHPGTAFTEMQFYPPGWAPWPAGISCDPTKWCAALVIWSLGYADNLGLDNNTACLSTVGEETPNFAFITLNGVAQAPANAVDSTIDTYVPDPTKDLFMNGGDQLIISMHDTTDGFKVDINDLTSGQTGFMTASIANGFGSVKFDPNGTTCQSIPYAFHPMYSTSSEHTRVPWTAHSYNVSFSDEIGHFEYCNGVDANGNCTSAGVNDPSGLDGDDAFCFGPDDSLRIPVGGCTYTDYDFDGVPYQPVWPGSNPNPGQDHLLHSTSTLFSSPVFLGQGGGMNNYSRVGFEADMPAIEFATNPSCNNFTGEGCTNPPAGANFYPIFTTRPGPGGCAWQEGGIYIPGTKNTFGGSSTSEFGPLLQLFYPDVGGPIFLYEDFRNVLSNNPCPQNPQQG
jgi:hypothetical protein